MNNNVIRHKYIYALFLFLALYFSEAKAQKLYTGASGGNWGTAGNWQGSTLPTSSDSVLIPDGRNVTIDVAAVCQSLTIQTGSANTTLTISGSNSLSVTNLIKLDAVSPTNNRNHTIAIGAGTVSCRAIEFGDNKSSTRVSQITMSTGKLTVTEDITFLGSSNGENKITMTGAATMVVGGNFLPNTAYTVLTTATGSKVIFNGDNAQSISSGLTFADLQFYGNGTKTFSGTSTTTVGRATSDSLDISTGTTVDVGTMLITASGTGRVFNVAGTLITANTAGLNGSTSTTFVSTNTPTITLAAGCTIHYNSTSAQTISARTDYKNIEISGASIKSLAGTTTLANNLTINTGATLSQGANALNVTGNISGDGDITATSGIITLSGDFSTTGTFTCGTGTVNYNRSGVQIVKGTTYNNLTISDSGIKTMNGDASVNASLTLTAGNLSIASNTLSLNGTFAGTGTGTLIGSGTSSLSIGGSSAVGTLRFDNTSRANKTLSSFTLNNTNAGNSVTLNNAATADTLLIADALTLTDGVLVSNGRLLLLSNATNTARVAPVTNGSITGNIHVERFIPGGSGKRKWRLMSFPVNNSGTMTWQAIKDYIMVTGSGTGFDAGINSVPSLRTYDETLSGSSSNGWVGPSAITNTVSTGTGFEVFVRGTRGLANQFSPNTVPDNVTFRFSGSMNTGNYTVNLSYTNSSNTGDGLNLVGNPYPSPIDFSTGINLTNTDDKFWCYNPNTTLYGLYDISLAQGTNAITPYIASGQGFFVQALGSGASIQFTENCKTSNTPNNYFRKSSTPSVQSIKLSLYKYENIKDQLIIAFNSSYVTTASDRDDAYKLFNDNLNFYSKSEDNANMTINALPCINKLDTINLCVYSYDTTAVNIGLHTIMLEELKNYNDSNELYLLDTYTNTTTNLLQIDRYTFNIDTNKASYGANRFKLIFKTINTGVFQSTNRIDFNIYPNPSNNSIQFQFNSALVKSDSHYKIVDLVGKILLEGNYTGEAINIDTLSSGLYYIEVSNGNNTGKTKFIKL